MLAKIEDGVGNIVFNQPQKHNAISVEMWGALDEVLSSWDEDQAVRVVVLSGAGDKAFISGADIEQLEKTGSNPDARSEYERLTSAGRSRLGSFSKPTIARIRGYCLGGGLAIAMQADLRIASEDSSFGIPAARLGISYGFDYVQLLVSLVGPANARMMLYTGDRIDSAEALRIGLVNAVVENDQLNAVVDDLTRTIANNAPLSIRASRLIIENVLLEEKDRDMSEVTKANVACLKSEDYKEGRKAFLEKRSPTFRGE